MERYVIQTHLHGSASEGPGSYAAHDFAAAQAGYVDLIWWMDHDWRLANFAKAQSFGFDTDEEVFAIPNRKHDGEPPTMPILMKWEQVAGNAPDGSVSISTEHVCTGSHAYRLELPTGTQERSFALELKVEVFHERFPLFSHPHLRLAVRMVNQENNDCYPFVRLLLSQQPPDLELASICYQLGKAGRVVLNGKTLEVPLPTQRDGWVELLLNPADDVQLYGVPGGLDNSLHGIQIGLFSNGPSVVAYFDSLQLESELKGTQCLDELRKLISQSSFSLPSHVGIEISYYDQHINAFGANVPIPDYEHIPRQEFSSRYIVEHIHKHGGLACLNHPPTGNLPANVDKLVANRVYGVDLVEVAHGAGGLHERLTLLDRLAERGYTVTGIAASDAHGAHTGWGINGKAPAWVNHVWARSLSEADLMESLSLGRVYVVDPAEFAGTFTLTGPADVIMGDVVESSEFPTLTSHIKGLQPDDIVLWLINGNPARVELVASDDYFVEWKHVRPLRGIAAIRIQVYRPRLSTNPTGGIILASNPVYVTSGPLQTKHRVHLV